MITAKNVVRACLPRRTRNWLRSPSKSVRWAWDGIRSSIGANEIVQLRPGWNLHCHPAVSRFANDNQKGDPDQVKEFDAFISSTFSGMVFIDVGAHFGLFSMAALHYGGAKTKVIAIDPSPIACRIMDIQARLNDASKNITIVQASVSERIGWQDMVAVGVISGGYLVSPSEEHPVGERTRTKAVTLDQIAHDFEVLPTHIKIDVEGSEADVLRGGNKVLSNEVSPLLFLELHNQMIRERGENPEDSLILLKNFDYEIYGMDKAPLDTKAILSEPLIRVFAKKRRT